MEVGRMPESLNRKLCLGKIACLACSVPIQAKYSAQSKAMIQDGNVQSNDGLRGQAQSAATR